VRTALLRCLQFFSLFASLESSAGECLEDVLAKMRASFQEVTYDENNHVISWNIAGKEFKTPFLENAQQIIKTERFTSKVRREIQTAVRRTSSSKTSEGFREYGFVVVTLKGGRQVVSRFTSNQAHKISFIPAKEAVERVIDAGGEVEQIQIFHTHPIENGTAQERLSYGDVTGAQAVNKLLRNKYGLNRPAVVVAIPVLRQDEGIVFSFDTKVLEDAP
jgi:hypothetical protein